VLLLENIGTSVKVGPNQLPTLHHLLTEAAAILGMEAPDLYVRQVGMFYASCAWIGSARPGGLGLSACVAAWAVCLAVLPCISC